MNDRRDDHRGHGDGHGGHGHAHGHGHGDGGDHHGGRGGPEGSEFLDLEMSKVLYGEASSLVRAAFSELLKDEIKARLRDRLGDKIDGLARIAVDDLLGDLTANLAVESIIGKRAEAKKETERRLRELFEAPPNEG